MDIISTFEDIKKRAHQDAREKRLVLDYIAEPLVKNFDESHGITHLRNASWFYHQITPKSTPYYPEGGMAIYFHDCIDHKYLTPPEIEGVKKFLTQVFETYFQNLNVPLIFRIIDVCSLSKRTKKLAAGEPEFPEDIARVCRYVSDADLLDAYDPRRVMTFQANAKRNADIPQDVVPILIKSWCKTIFVKRILLMKDLYIRTPEAMALATEYHPLLEKWIESPEVKVWWDLVTIQPY